MPGNILTTSAGLYDPQQMFSINLIPLTGSTSAIVGNVVTITTTTAHGFGTVLTSFQRVPGYNVSTGGGPQLGVIISGAGGSTILNSTWLVQAAPTTTTFTILLTPAQAALATVAMTAGTITPFVTLPPGWWDIVPANSDILQWCPTLPPGPVGGTNTTVSGVVGGSVLPFGLLGNAAGAPIGGGTYVNWLAGSATLNGDSIQTDGVSYFMQFGVTAGVSRIFKRL